MVEPKKAVLREAEAALVAAAEKLAAKQAQLAEVEAQVGGAFWFFENGFTRKELVLATRPLGR